MLNCVFDKYDGVFSCVGSKVSVEVCQRYHISMHKVLAHGKTTKSYFYSLKLYLIVKLCWRHNEIFLVSRGIIKMIENNC